MNYNEAMEWLYARLPMFQRVGKSAYKADLSNILLFCDHLNNPQNTFKTVHVAGTNGKGSTSHMIASCLQEAGYKTGLHTSPHLKSFCERSRINGEEMKEELVVKFIEDHGDFIASHSFSFFEVAVALGFLYFAENRVDIAVIETGLGGRLDSTNIIHPELSVITNIGKDHTVILGDALQLIAAEKAGIIKKNTPVVIGEYLSETRNIFEKKAAEMNAEIFFAEDEFRKETYNFGLKFLEFSPVELKGKYQEKNRRTAVLALKILAGKGWNISDENIRNGLANVVKNTGLRGRWDILGEKPLIVADTAHNPDGIQMVIQQIKETEFEKLHLVLGFVNDKDVASILNYFPTDAKYYFSAPEVPRRLPLDDLKIQIPTDLDAEFFESVKLALEAAKQNAGQNDMIYIGGSTFVVAEII